MDVILLEKVQNLGNLGDRVKVRSGYGRNFLLPKGKAVAATPDNIAKFEERRAELEKALAEAVAAAEGRAAKLEGLSVTIKHRAGDEGRLFGTVSPAEIAEAITQASGEEISRKEIDMGGQSLREVGEYDVRVMLHADVAPAVKVVIEAE
ncbi:50S ribosomal protein L9 [Ectothiorhodospiraceae bacterium 2226]|nr:50S ribosomal protein L9 [Ectothiorhodospiraceae bacterium 2226]